MAGDRRAGAAPANELSLPALGEHPAPARRLGVRVGAQVEVVEIAAIDWIESYGDYARVHVGRQTHVVAQRMHALERMFERGDFLRIHRSLIVNLQRVRRLHREPDGGGTLVLDSGVRLRVARGRWEALQAALRMHEV